MKITLTEKQLNELKGQFKDEVEIIYRDSTIVCMIPKSQMTSFIYGHKAEWCQRRPYGFQEWSEMGLLIRFLFKNGRKIRFTYLYDDKKKDNYYWANENGFHVLEGMGNPFEAKAVRADRIRSTEKDIINLITQIPEPCKEKVLHFIKKYKKKKYEYCKVDSEYTPKRIEMKSLMFDEFMNQQKDRLDQLHFTHYLVGKFNKATNMYVIGFSDTYGVKGNYLIEREEFKEFGDFKKRFLELLNEYLSKKTNYDPIYLDEGYPGGWNIDTFRTLRSFAQRVNYCHQHLQRISSGSSRIVYKIDEEKVLKLAKNRKGIEQNETEYQWRNDGFYHYILGNVIDGDENGTWIEMELAQKISPSTFKKFMDGVSFNTYSWYIRLFIGNRTKEWFLRHMSEEEYEILNESEFVNKVINFIRDGDYPDGDYCRLSSYGVVNREGVPTLVLVDYGITSDALKNLYHRG